MSGGGRVPFATGAVASTGGGGASTADAVSFTPTGTIAATDVQAAVAEVASEAVQSSALTELVQDVVGALLADSTELDFTYDDAGNAETIAFKVGGVALSKLASDPLARANHTGTQLAATVSDFSEAVDDRVAVLLTAGTNITLTYNDGAGTLTVDAAAGGSSTAMATIYAFGG